MNFLESENGFNISKKLNACWTDFLIVPVNGFLSNDLDIFAKIPFFPSFSSDPLTHQFYSLQPPTFFRISK